MKETPLHNPPKVVPDAKSQEETLRERETLSRMYRNIHSRWENYKGRYGIPTKLDENFVLVWWLRSGLLDNEAPSSYFEYVSSYGCFRMNIWHIDKERKRIIVNEELYTLGPEGKTRGKGKKGYQGIEHVLQSISDASGYSVHDIATPNKASTHLFEKAGYRLFTEVDEEELAPAINSRDKTRWDKMMASAKPFPSMIRVFNPSSKELELNERENGEIDTILKIAFLKRK